jgi:hypothetical protein
MKALIPSSLFVSGTWIILASVGKITSDNVDWLAGSVFAFIYFPIALGLAMIALGVYFSFKCFSKDVI